MNIEDIKRLKELTGVGLTDAKSALTEANGDFDQALEAMRKKGLTKADKRGEREARQGIVYSYNHDSRIGVVVEVNCETDFVARNEIFTELAKDVAMHIAASNPEYVSADDISSEAREAKKPNYWQVMHSKINQPRWQKRLSMDSSRNILPKDVCSISHLSRILIKQLVIW